MPKTSYKVSEKDLQSAVIGAAQTLGWKVAHFRSVRTQRPDGTVRYLTPVQADGGGFPDLCMVRGGRIIFAELKSATGVVEAAQERWLDELALTPAETYVWRPAAWFGGEIERILL